jgi:two-component system, LytTR family, sensor kinase
MNSQSAASLINILGFLTGTALYGMLLAMTLEARQAEKAQAEKAGLAANRLPLLTAVCGLIWNLGSFAAFGLVNFRESVALSVLPLWLTAVAFAALGLLPAVVVHSVLRNASAEVIRARARHWLARLAYGLSIAAGLLHLLAALRQSIVPSHIALHLLTAGFVVLIVALLLLLRRQSLWRQAGWLIALAIFTVSAQHLSHHEGENYPWWLELIGHHSSLPLAFVILYQDYRFALADLFLKRALTLLTLVALAGGLYALTGWIWIRLSAAGVHEAPTMSILLCLWFGLTLCYPALQRGVRRFVDAVILQRVDYEALRQEIAQAITEHEAAEPMLDEVCQLLAQALTAREVTWHERRAASAEADSDTVAPWLLPLIQRAGKYRAHKQARLLLPRAEAPTQRANEHDDTPEATTEVVIPTSEPPQYRLRIGALSGGRRLLSDDLALLETVALMTARRLDVMRVTHERIAHTLREQEMSALATEAELRALRAQLNPHFLFNALTTIGWLIQSAPERALSTLLKLTTLLRSVLRHSDEDLTTLGAEIELIETYLEIERARFEDRLRVRIDVPAELREIRLPALLLQPLVENAIKHGITPLRAGGEILLVGYLDAATQRLHLQIRDTGAGANAQQIAQGKTRGIGLSNVERRLQTHYRGQAQFNIHTAPQQGMMVELVLPMTQAERKPGKKEMKATGRTR